MENTRRRRSGGLLRIITAVFAVAFVASIVSTITALAAANLFKIENAELSELSTTAEGSISSFDETGIVSNVTFHKLGDSAKYTITLKNTDNTDHVIESITDDNESPYISYEYDQHMGEQINAGENFVFVLTAKYSTSITDVNQRAQANNVKFFIHFTDLEEEVPVVPNTGTNPNTSDHIHSSVLSLVISAVGFIIIGIVALKKHKKASKFIVAGIVAVAAIATTATVKAATVEINSFTISASYVLKDKLVVTYTDNDGNDQELIVSYGEPTNIPDQNKDGYTLTGWEDENSNPVDLSQPVTEDIKIHPIYRAHTYTVKFNGNGANGEMADIAMTFDETKTLPANAFDFPGHTYAGWGTETNGSGIHYDDQAEAKNLTTEDNGIVTLYAQWSINPFHIDYDGNGATSGEMATTNCEYDGECVLRENAFEKTGYHFAGWKYNNTDYADNADVKNIIESGTITMVAQWEVNHYTIAFDGSGATSGSTASMTMAYDEEKNLTMNGFEKTGYTFAGWKLGDTEYTNGQTVENLTDEDGATVTLEAQWTPTEYTIIFHANNENVENPDAMAAQVVTYDVETTLNPIEYTWWQHKFVEWTTNTNGTGTKYADKAAIKNLNTNGGEVHLYAQWKESTATLTQGWNNTAALKRINADATSFEHWTGETPDFETIDGEENIALSSSNFPVYAWTEDNKIYWWSEATTIYMNASSTRMFSGMEKLQSIDISQFDSSLLTSLEGMFENTTALTSINFGNNFQTGNVTNFRDMFSKAKSLAELDLHTWDVSSFNMDLRKVFNGCSSLTSLNLDGWDLSHTTTNGAHDWLSGTNSLQTFSMKGGKLPSNANSLFADLKATTINLDNLDTSRVTDMQMMFARAAGAIELDLHTWNVSSVNNMSQMFIGAKFTGINIDGWQTSSLTNMTSIFNGCINLANIDLSNIDTSKVQNMQGAFMLTPMTTLDLSTWDTSKNTSVRTMFSGMKNVETIYVGDGWSTELITGVNDSATLPLNDMTNKLVGGAGTVWSDDKKNGLTYLHLDDPCDNNPGLFSKKNARYVCYYSNIPEGEANAGAKTGDYVMIEGGSLAANTFTRSGYVFTGWKDADNNEYTDEQAMTGLAESKTPLELYAQWIEATSVLKTGPDVNIILKSINPDAVAFTRYNGIPDLDAIADKQVISLSNAVVPTYAWSDGDTIYWWSEAKTVYLNENSGSFFKNLSNLTTIEQTTLDTSKVKNMDYMFQYSGLVDFTFEMDTSNVMSMDAIFANCSKLERLDLSHVDTSKVTNMHGLVADAQKLTYLNLDNFSTASATNMESMFSTVKRMTTLDLTSFDTRNVTNMGWMISYITNLQTIYATDLFVPANNISMPSTLVGGAGSRNLGTSKVYARIDDPDNGNPGYFTMKGARYIRYYDNDDDNTNDEANYALMTSHYLKAGDSLKKNTFTRGGYVFTGWKDADNNEYTDEQVMTSLTESKTPLELYAQWDVAPYTVTFNANGGEVLQSAKTVTYQQPYGELPTPVRYDYTTDPSGSILGSKYGFKEWNTKADGSGDTITPSLIYTNTDDTTLYAIWNDQFTVTIYNGESETPTTASYGVGDIVYLNAQNVAGKQFLYWEVDGAKKAYTKDYSMRMFQGKDLTIRAIYGSESDLESQQPGTYISDIYRQYSNNKVFVRSYSYVPDGYQIVKAGVVATLDANIANGTFDDQTATYPRAASVNGSSDNYYYTWSKSNVTSGQTVYVKAYLIYKDADGVEHTIYGDLVTATLTE